MDETLDELADEHDLTRSDVIRSMLDDGLNTDDDVEIQRLRFELEDLERENERIRRFQTNPCGVEAVHDRNQPIR